VWEEPRSRVLQRVGAVTSVRWWRAVVLTGFARPLAADERRVAYWRRHVLIGVVLSEVAGASALLYALLTTTPAHDHPVVLVLAVAVLLGSPGLLVLPWDSWVRDRRGAMMFYAWSMADTAVIAVVARLDGGGGSPLSALMFLTLAFMAVAYPPLGVLAMGGVMTAVHLAVICSGQLTLSAGFFALVMVAFTICCALSSGNSWDAYEQTLLLLRTQEVLANTDVLTGALNRRAFLARLQQTAAGSTDPALVCLVDLDGFKAVNDRDGHAAGDAALVAVTRALSATVREVDTVARLGGDEFALLLPGTTAAIGERVAARVRAAVAEAGAGIGVTASIGVASLVPGEDVHALLHRADAAMYAAKTAGGDRVSADH
jgi:diguanylate cyclase (GGDEF)-like protein